MSNFRSKKGYIIYRIEFFFNFNFAPQKVFVHEKGTGNKKTLP